VQIVWLRTNSFHVCSVECCNRGEFGGKSTLAHTRLANKDDALACLCPSDGKPFAQLSHLRLTPDERCPGWIPILIWAFLADSSS
jgi:hypothetical protein